MNLENDAKNKFLQGDFVSAEKMFKQSGHVLEYAYCRLLAGDLKEAEFEFSKISDNDLRANWAKTLISFINLYVPKKPTYFQVRNFLEIDLHFLIQAAQAEYVENIINGADIFYSVNPESYKFIARVLAFNNFDEIALLFLKKAKDKLYYDPEMHYMLAVSYLKLNDLDLAKLSLQNCLEILPGYFPAAKLLDKISQ